jgi:hypothetical protein
VRKFMPSIGVATMTYLKTAIQSKAESISAKLGKRTQNRTILRSQCGQARARWCGRLALRRSRGGIRTQDPLQGVARDNREKYHFCITFPDGYFSCILVGVCIARVFIGFDGESAGARTQDQRLKRAMLYQLSYALKPHYQVSTFNRGNFLAKPRQRKLLHFLALAGKPLPVIPGHT